MTTSITTSQQDDDDSGDPPPAAGGPAPTAITMPSSSSSSFHRTVTDITESSTTVEEVNLEKIDEEEEEEVFLNTIATTSKISSRQDDDVAAPGAPATASANPPHPPPSSSSLLTPQETPSSFHSTEAKSREAISDAFDFSTDNNDVYDDDTGIIRNNNTGDRASDDDNEADTAATPRNNMPANNHHHLQRQHNFFIPTNISNSLVFTNNDFDDDPINTIDTPDTRTGTKVIETKEEEEEEGDEKQQHLQPQPDYAQLSQPQHKHTHPLLLVAATVAAASTQSYTQPRRIINRHKRIHTHGEIPELDRLLETNPLVEEAILTMKERYDGGINVSERLYQNLETAGSQAYGIIGIEIWQIENPNDNSNKLVQPDGGFWVASDMLPKSDALSKLKDPNHPQYIPAGPAFSGYDLAGVLWAACSRQKQQVSKKHNYHHPNSLLSSLQRRHRGDRKNNKQPAIVGLVNKRHTDGLAAMEEGSDDYDKDLESAIRTFNNQTTNYNYRGRTMNWRNIQTLVNDPDTPKSNRMEALLDAGLGQAAAIPFREDNTEGMVIYYARSTANTQVLLAVEIQEFLFRKTKQFACQLSMLEVAKALKVSKDRAIKAAWLQFVHNLLQHKRELDKYHSRRGYRDYKMKQQDMMTTTATIDTDETNDTTSSRFNFIIGESTRRNIRRFSTNYVIDPMIHGMSYAPTEVVKTCRLLPIKWRGGNAQIPPPMSTRQSLWTFFGSFISLMFISGMNELIKYRSNGRMKLMMGPYGALVTLLYGLHSAPSSQPRNVLYGEIVCAGISLLLTLYVFPNDFLPDYIRVAISPAIGIAAMCRFGVMHPPATAVAMTYALGNDTSVVNWEYFCISVLTSILSTLPAMVLNNLSHRRQYPIYWGNITEYAAAKLKTMQQQQRTTTATKKSAGKKT